MKRLAGICSVVVVILGLTVPSSASSAGNGIFHTTCRATNHALPDDPIVFPNQPGASHRHDFFGNLTTNAYSTFASLTAGTSDCTVHGGQDFSGYWVPQLYYHGAATNFSESQAYYDGEAGGRVQTPPSGFAVIGGSAKAVAPLPTYAVKWTCDGNSGVPGATHPPTFCPTGTKLKIVVKTPNCVSSSFLANDVSGVNATPYTTYAAANGGHCPGGYAAFPTVRIEVKYPITGAIDPNAITLSSGCSPMPCATGPWWTMHGDWFNAWNPQTLDTFVQRCINRGTDCGNTVP